MPPSGSLKQIAQPSRCAGNLLLLGELRKFEQKEKVANWFLPLMQNNTYEMLNLFRQGIRISIGLFCISNNDNVIVTICCVLKWPVCEPWFFFEYVAPSPISPLPPYSLFQPLNYTFFPIPHILALSFCFSVQSWRRPRLPTVPSTWHGLSGEAQAQGRRLSGKSA